MKRFDIDSLDNRDPVRIARVIALLEPALTRYFRPVIKGLDRIPRGPVLYVGNHSSGLLTPDTFTFGIAAFRAHGLDAVPYGLGHELAIALPLINQFIAPLGAVRASHDNARRLLARGRKVLVYPGGDLDAFRAHRDRDRVVFGPRRGYIRLALHERVSIVPIVTAGAHETFRVLDDGRWLAHLLGTGARYRIKAWPIVLSIPWGLTVGPPLPHLPWRTRIYQEVLSPIRFARDGPDAAEDREHVERCHHHVLDTMQRALSRLAAERSDAMRRS